MLLETKPMKVFNKIWVVIDILIIIPLLTVALAMPDMSIVWLRQGLDALAPRVAALSTSNRLIMAAVAVGVDLLLVALLYFELRKTPTTHARVRRVDGGVVEVAFEAIRQRLLHHVSNVSDVLKVTPYVSTRGGKVDVQVDVETSPHVVVPEKASEIVVVIRRAIESEMGLKVRRKPEVRIYHGAYRDVESKRPTSAPSPSRPSPPDSMARMPDINADVPPPPGRDEPPTKPGKSR
jgi:hypothetical protein